MKFMRTIGPCERTPRPSVHLDLDFGGGPPSENDTPSVCLCHRGCGAVWPPHPVGNLGGHSIDVSTLFWVSDCNLLTVLAPLLRAADRSSWKYSQRATVQVYTMFRTAESRPTRQSLLGSHGAESSDPQQASIYQVGYNHCSRI